MSGSIGYLVVICTIVPVLFVLAFLGLVSGIRLLFTAADANERQMAGAAVILGLGSVVCMYALYQHWQTGRADFLWAIGAALSSMWVAGWCWLRTVSKGVYGN